MDKNYIQVISWNLQRPIAGKASCYQQTIHR